MVHEATGDTPAEVIRDINLHRYRERMHLSYADAINEPNEVVERAFVIWSLEAVRDKLKVEKRKLNN